MFETLSASDSLLTIDTTEDKIVEKADLSDISCSLHLSFGIFLKIGFTVVNNCFSEKVRATNGLKIDLSSFSDLFLEVGSLYGHLVLGQSTSLVSADLIGVAHSLRAAKFADKVILILHLADRVGERNGDGEG